MNQGPRIVFMGTPAFAVASLKALIEAKMNVVAVVTAPDKPAGRGMQLQESAVKQFAQANQLPVLQPEKLKAPRASSRDRTSEPLQDQIAIHQGEHRIE